MRLYSFFLFLLHVVITTSYAQIDIINTSLNDVSKNELYIGLVNNLKIEGLGEGLGVLNINDQENIELERNIYQYVPYDTPDSMLTFSIYRDGTLLFEKQFRLINKAEPKLCIKGDVEENSVEELIRSREFQICYPNSNYHSNVYISSYKVFYIIDTDTILHIDTFPIGKVDTILVIDPVTLQEEFRVYTSDEETYAYDFYGSNLSISVIERLVDLKKGNLCLITDINVIFPNGVRRRLENVIFEKAY